MIRYLFTIFFLLISSILLAQQADESLSSMIEEIVEQISADEESDIDLTSLLEDLYYFAENPININNTSESQLNRLHFLNNYQISNLLDYPSYNGEFVSIYELQLIDGYDMETIRKLLPFVTLKESEDTHKLRLRTALKYGRNQVLLRYQNTIERAKGYESICDSLLSEKPNSRYLGSSPKLYARYNFSFHNRLKFGLTGEKDSGEEFFKGSQKQGFDFSSFHFQLKNKGVVKQINLGDFHARFGQGLIMWTGYSFGKSVDNLFGLERTGQGLSSYSSVDEFNFLRGAGLSLEKNNISLNLYASSKLVDGNISDKDTLQDEEIIVSSLQLSGIHATASQMIDRHSVRENIFGANLNYRFKSAYVGLNYVHESYDSEIIRDESLWNQFYFQGNELSNLSVDYRFRILNVSLFGETAINDKARLATINGAKFRLSNIADFIIVNRYYPKEYYAVRANAFGEKQSVSNETGTFLGLEMTAFSRWKFSTWFDMYSFPWLRFGVDAPSSGYEYLLQGNYYYNHNFQMYFRYKFEQYQKNASTELSATGKLSDISKQSIRYNLIYSVNDNLRFKNRIEWSFYGRDENSENGWLIYQDVKYSFLRFPLSLSARFAVFDTQSWYTRIYAWEDDVLYSFSVPAMYSKGIRSYLVARWKINTTTSAWFRISQTAYADKDIISSGLNEIQGNRKTEVKLMLRLKF